MSISHIHIKIKAFVRILDRRDVWACSCICLAGIGGYMAGRLDPLRPVAKGVEIRAGERFAAPQASSTLASLTASSTLPIPMPNKPEAAKKSAVQGKYVASKSGTKYHLPSCAGARSMAEANKVWFATKREAETAGYSPASNCKGI